jgi:hypothetical protein
LGWFSLCFCCGTVKRGATGCRFGNNLLLWQLICKTIVRMKTLKLLRNIFFVFYFGWMSLAGIIAVGLLYWATPLSASLSDIVMTGAVLGISVGGAIAFIAFMLVWKKYKATLKAPFEIIDVLRRRM